MPVLWPSGAGGAASDTWPLEPDDALADGARVIRAPEIRLGSADASEYVALANLVNQELSNLWSAFNSHVHNAANVPTTTPITVSSNDPPPAGALSGEASDIAAHKVKAK